VAPVQVLEEQDHGARRALGDEQILPGAEHLVAHEHGIVTGRAELDALPILEAYARELAEKLGYARDVFFRQMPGHARPELLLAHGAGFAARGAGFAAEHLGEHAKR